MDTGVAGTGATEVTMQRYRAIAYGLSLWRAEGDWCLVTGASRVLNQDDAGYHQQRHASSDHAELPPSPCRRGRRKRSPCGLAHPAMTVVEPTNPAAWTAAITVAS